MRSAILGLLWVCALPALAFDSKDLQLAREQLVDNPQALLQRYGTQPSELPALETERLLLVGFAHLELSNQPELALAIEQLHQRPLTPIQQNRLLLLEGSYVGAMLSEFEHALELFASANLALAAMSEPEALSLHIDVLLKSGSLLRYLRRTPEAIEVLGKARKRALLAGDNARLAKVEHHLGRSYRLSQMHGEAVEHYRSAISLSNEIRDPDFPVMLSMELARLLRETGEYEEALDYAHQAAQQAQEINERHLLANALSEVAYVHERREDHSQALHYHLLALTNLERIDTPLGVAAARHDIGRVYLDSAQAEKALEYFNKAQPVFEQRGHRRYLFVNGLRMAQAHVSLDQLEQAQRAAAPLKAIAEQQQERDLQREFWHTLATINKLLGQDELAWGQLSKALNIHVPTTDITGVQSSKALSSQQLKSDLSQRDRQLAQQGLELQRLQVQRQIGGASLVLLVLILLTLWRRHHLQGRHLSKSRAALLTEPVSGAGNRQALVQALDQTPAGALVLLQLGSLAQGELEVGQHRHSLDRRALTRQLAEIQGVSQVLEISPGAFALVVQTGAIQEWLPLLLSRAQAWPELSRYRDLPIAAGSIPLPFQPGSMLRLAASQSLELCQLALWSAIRAAQEAGQPRYVLLQPIALNAPLLQPDQVYESATKCIQNGVIRCISNHQQELSLPNPAEQDSVITLTNPSPNPALKRAGL
ncbi:tetratricopeptide repeat protein [Ferrimonas marina]|uniref:Tetratricopeptide repeat-containing protein n=1 Tax=Ferrimonas marina TaxID=299255 RepID=A0A1M5SAT0_9GAMM|nr:tetratricopeptide repeat protein [Ferrimonas marina]SHH35614.1 Tetratricopeptide repeat-containing protein [Ferrimonas marina]